MLQILKKGWVNDFLNAQNNQMHGLQTNQLNQSERDALYALKHTDGEIVSISLDANVNCEWIRLRVWNVCVRVYN